MRNRVYVYLMVFILLASTLLPRDFFLSNEAFAKSELSNKDFQTEEEMVNEDHLQNASAAPGLLSNVCSDTGNIQLILRGDDNQALFPRDAYMATVGINVSGDGAEFSDTKVTLTFNHDRIKDINMDLPSQAKKMELRKENGKAYFDIYFNALRGGGDFSFDVPIYIDNDNGAFPENYTSIISGSLETQLQIQDLK